MEISRNNLHRHAMPLIMLGLAVLVISAVWLSGIKSSGADHGSALAKTFTTSPQKPTRSNLLPADDLGQTAQQVFLGQ